LLDDRGDFKVSESARLLGPLPTSELRLFTVVEVAKVLSIGRSKVYELLYAGDLKSVKIGGSRRVRYSDLGDYVRCLDDAS
jgi:excisionase family DNA binding protein